MSTTPPLLQTDNLQLAYGAFNAVNGVNLKVEQGTIHTVIGPNGAGKTSLFHCLTGERQATGGTIVFDGKHILKKPSHGHVVVLAAAVHMPPEIKGVQSIAALSRQTQVLAHAEVLEQAGELE